MATRVVLDFITGTPGPATPPCLSRGGVSDPSIFLYEVVECGRRIMLTGALVFIQPNTTEQAGVACTIAFVSVLGFELLRPHIDNINLWLYRMVRSRCHLPMGDLGDFYLATPCAGEKHFAVAHLLGIRPAYSCESKLVSCFNERLDLVPNLVPRRHGLRSTVS